MQLTMARCAVVAGAVALTLSPATAEITKLTCSGMDCKVTQGTQQGHVRVNFVNVKGAVAGQPMILKVVDTVTNVPVLIYRFTPSASDSSPTYMDVVENSPRELEFTIAASATPDLPIANGQVSIDAVAQAQKPGFFQQFVAAMAAASQTSTTGAAGMSGAMPSNVVGTWYGTANTIGMGQIQMNADGSYAYNGSPAGTYAVVPGGIRFTGNLAAWNGGIATLRNGNLEFTWTSANGAKNWFSFAKKP